MAANETISFASISLNSKFVQILFGGILSIGGFQPISRDTDDNGETNKCWGRTKGANERSIVFVHQHGGDDVT